MPSEGTIIFDHALSAEEAAALAKVKTIPPREDDWRLERFQALDAFLTEVDLEDGFAAFRRERERLRSILRGQGYEVPPPRIDPPAGVDVTLRHHGRVWWLVATLHGIEVWDGQTGGMAIYLGRGGVADNLPSPIRSSLLDYWNRLVDSQGFLIFSDTTHNEATWYYGNLTWHLRWDRLDTVEVTPEGDLEPFTWTLGQELPSEGTTMGALLDFWVDHAVRDGVSTTVVGDEYVVRVLLSGRVWYEHEGEFFYHEGPNDPVPPEVLTQVQALYQEHAARRDRARAPAFETHLVQTTFPPAPLAFGVSDDAGDMVNKLEVWHDHFVVDGVRVEVDHPAEARMVLDTFLTTIGEARHGNPYHFFSAEKRGLPTLWDHIAGDEGEAQK